jgi:hypothetical protein
MRVPIIRGTTTHHKLQQSGDSVTRRWRDDHPPFAQQLVDELKHRLGRGLVVCMDVTPAQLLNWRTTVTTMQIIFTGSCASHGNFRLGRGTTSAPCMECVLNTLESVTCNISKLGLQTPTQSLYLHPLDHPLNHLGTSTCSTEPTSPSFSSGRPTSPPAATRTI